MTKELLIAFGLVATIPLIPVGADALGAHPITAQHKNDVAGLSSGYSTAPLGAVRAHMSDPADRK